MREEGVIRSRTEGDRPVAQDKLGEARVQLGILKNLMQLGGVQSLSRQITMSDGTVISVSSIMGQDTVKIDAPVKPPVPENPTSKQPEPPLLKHAEIISPPDWIAASIYIGFDPSVTPSWVEMMALPRYSVTYTNGMTSAQAEVAGKLSSQQIATRLDVQELPKYMAKALPREAWLGTPGTPGWDSHYYFWGQPIAPIGFYPETSGEIPVMLNIVGGADKGVVVFETTLIGTSERLVYGGGVGTALKKSALVIPSIQNHDAPGDANGDNIYKFTLQAMDVSGKIQDTQDCTISIKYFFRFDYSHPTLSRQLSVTGGSDWTAFSGLPDFMYLADDAAVMSMINGTVKSYADHLLSNIEVGYAAATTGLLDISALSIRPEQISDLYAIYIAAGSTTAAWDAYVAGIFALVAGASKVDCYVMSGPTLKHDPPALGLPYGAYEWQFDEAKLNRGWLQHPSDPGYGVGWAILTSGGPTYTTVTNTLVIATLQPPINDWLDVTPIVDAANGVAFSQRIDNTVPYKTQISTWTCITDLHLRNNRYYQP